MKALDTNDEEYQARLHQHKQCYQIANELDMGRGDIELAELVNLEVSFIASSELASFCANKVYEWRQEKNPYSVDLILIACEKHGILPPPSLIRVIGEAASARFNGDPAGTPDKLKNENAQGQALILMANLIFAGDTLQVASQKAAQWHRDTFSELKRQKASTLETYYTKKIRRTGLERVLFTNWRENQSQRDEEQLNEQWQAIRELLKPADDDLTGVRRR